MSSRPTRPSVDVVCPFAGDKAALDAVAESLSRMELQAGDTVTIVDNNSRPVGETAAFRTGRILEAPERQSSYFARNRGAASGSAPWLLFIDADVEPPADLLDLYGFGTVSPEVGALAGGIVDVAVGPETTVSRFLTARASMSQANTLRGDWAYAQTANCAVRRDAFEAVGGFLDDIRSGGDADLCFRLRAAGWGLEGRESAAVSHRARTSMAALVRQRARHGSGSAWLDGAYPGSFPARSWLGLVRWTLTEWAGGLGSLVRGDRRAAELRFVDPVSSWALQLGRLLPNRVASER